MKEQIRMLKNIVELGRSIGKAIKPNRGKILITSALPLIFANNVNGERSFLVYNGSRVNGSEKVVIKHMEGATEGHDSNDVLYLEGPWPLHIYSHNANGIDYMVDARPPNSTTAYDLHLKNTGFSGIADNYLRFLFNDYQIPINFSWKNIFLGDANDSDNIVADIKYIINHGSTLPPYNFRYGDFPLPDVDGSNVGIYDKRKVFFFNYADLNRDRKVNSLDFAILSQNYGGDEATDPNTFGDNVGSDPNNLNAYADIDRSGVVDINDLSIFSGEWLWDADDPSSW